MTLVSPSDIQHLYTMQSFKSYAFVSDVGFFLVSEQFAELRDLMMIRRTKDLISHQLPQKGNPISAFKKICISILS